MIVILREPQSQHKNQHFRSNVTRIQVQTYFTKTLHANPQSQVFHALWLLEQMEFILISISLLTCRSLGISSFDLSYINGSHQSKKLHPSTSWHRGQLINNFLRFKFVHEVFISTGNPYLQTFISSSFKKGFSQLMEESKGRINN